MRRIYLVNVGANTSDWSHARSPVFADGSFTFVSFSSSSQRAVTYPAAMLPFTNSRKPLKTHPDPDWSNLTYGDMLGNGRGAALGRTDLDDVLLFWSLLCANSGTDWDGFSGVRGWYLIGAMRIAYIMEAGQRLHDVPHHYRGRARGNAHIEANRLGDRQRIFIADKTRSARFDRAVDLGATEIDGLMYQTFRSKGGVPLTLGGSPRWSSSLRACRCMFDLLSTEDRKRAELVRAAILRQNKFDLLSA